MAENTSEKKHEEEGMDREEVIKRVRSGARVKVYEEKKAPFEGIVIARKHGNEAGATATVRTTIAGVGVERIFPLHSPAIKQIEVVSSPKKLKRSKLYFIRDLSAKKVRQKLRKVLAQ